MSKLFVVSFNLIILFAYKLFFGGDVTVEQKLPEEVLPGSTFKVTVEITKGDREGFAKWQQRLPQGFIASSIETQGATFSFKNQEVKLIWMSLPTDEKFTISYNVKVSDDLSGDFRIFGKFSYIEENERKDIAVYEHLLTVTSDAQIADETETNDDTSTDTDTESTETETAADEVVEEVAEEVVDEVVEDVQNDDGEDVDKRVVADKDGIRIERTVKHLGDSKYEVTLSIDKGGFRSFGKVEEYLPPNYTATEIENMEGIFSFTNKATKILWMTLPQDDKFEVKYAIESTDEDLDSGYVHGVFSFLDDDESRQLKLKQSRFRNYAMKEEVAEEVSEEVVDAVEETADETSDEIAEEVNDEGNDTENTSGVEEIDDTGNEVSEQVDDQTESGNDIVDNSRAQANRDGDLADKITNVPSPEVGISYKVQIAAGRKEVQKNYFVKRHGITEPVNIEFNDSWYKYTVGGFGVYKQARDRRNEIWAEENKIDDAFVTAYNSGERISVQEALMISKQKWYK